MKSEVFLMAIIIQHPSFENESFQNCLKRDLRNHTPNGIVLKSIEYKEDKFVSHLIHDMLHADSINNICKIVIQQGAYISRGYFTLLFESNNSIEGKRLIWLEEFINSSHNKYDFLISYFFYKSEVGLRHFGYYHDYEKYEELESFTSIKLYNRYINLFESYFKTGEIHDELKPFIAKLMLLNRIENDC